MANDELVKELARRLAGIAIVSSEITDWDLAGVDLEAVIAHTRNKFGDETGMHVLTKEILGALINDKEEYPEQERVEIIRSPDFRPTAKEMKDDFQIRNVSTEKTTGKVSDFADLFNDRLRKIKAIISDSNSSRVAGMAHSIESIKQYTGGREVVIGGIVYEKRITQNGHILLRLEDETGSANVLFYKPQKDTTAQNTELFNNASRIVSDEVVAVRGKISGPFVIANSLIHPDPRLPLRT